MITVQTTVNAQIDIVWEYWTIPEHIQKWNNPTDDWHTPYIENDLRPEGKFKYTMATKDKRISFDYEGIYTKVEHLSLITYKLHDNRIGSIQFEDQDNQVTITEIFEPNKENPESEQEQFCQGVIDNFKKYVEASSLTQQITKSGEVTEFLDQLNHPLREEIEELRKIILASNKNLTENIKWNAPNYCFEKDDRITMKVLPVSTQIQLIFHRGAKKQEQPKGKLIANNSKMLVWKENDRAIITFKNSQDIESGKAALEKIINEWINATKK
nr:DUF1801 domain-containing protein [uncultured Flavobacterium sp.]